jgi:hypothetical protein
MNEKDFLVLMKGQYKEYCEGRWNYYEAVINLVKEIKPLKVLEIGPGKSTIVKKSDIMINPIEDKYGRPDFEYSKSIIFNATEKPWPIKDKEYDLIIALQVWEHLTNKQSRAFREVIRTSKKAILSFPYLWDCHFKDNHRFDHHMIDEEIISDWTSNVKPMNQTM